MIYVSLKSHKLVKKNTTLEEFMQKLDEAKKEIYKMVDKLRKNEWTIPAPPKLKITIKDYGAEDSCIELITNETLVKLDRD